MATADLEDLLVSSKALVIAQRKELAELFGWESRNKYEIRDESGEQVGFAAEQENGLFGMIGRQFLGHWRPFDIHIFDADRQPILVAHHPFRILFQRIDVSEADGQPLGALQQRFSILTKRFDIQDAAGRVLMEVRSPLWRPWTFRFERDGEALATVRKRWSGMLKEMFLDADNFRIDFDSPALTAEERKLLVAAALFVDLIYFERKAG